MPVFGDRRQLAPVGDLTKRTLKGFVDNMFSDKDDRISDPTVYFSAGVKCGF